MIVSLTWSPVANALSYNVYRSTTSGANFQPIAYTVTQAAYTDGPGGLDNSTIYYYSISTVTLDGESALTPQVIATPMGPLGAPSGLAAVVT